MSTAKTIIKQQIEKSDVSLLNQVDSIRCASNKKLDQQRRAEMGQFMTPAPVARLMACMFENLQGEIHLLDAGAGVGSLSAAVVEEACKRNVLPKAITLNSYEPEAALAKALKQTMSLCDTICTRNDINFSAKIIQKDFIEQATGLLNKDLFSDRIQPRFNRAILNPPYRKINSASRERKLLRSMGIETSNLYTAFVALAIKLLDNDGEIVAITPRSFCNGPYFKPFRKLLFDTMTLKKIHIFHARNKAFKEDTVLQENIIFHMIKRKKAGKITILSSTCADDPNVVRRMAQPREVVTPDDPDQVIHIPTTDEEGRIALKARGLPCSLQDLKIEVSTGRVVDFRATDYIIEKPKKSTVPLIYPSHFENGFISWPKLKGRKPNAILDNANTADLLVPSGTYVLVKRFSSKEERRRVVAAIYDCQKIKAKRIGFENHLNYYHINGDGVTKNLAKGLSVFLNSSLVDQYFRQFSGHTQINATDLRSLRYPTLTQLKKMGNRIKNKLPTQERIDLILDEELFS